MIKSVRNLAKLTAIGTGVALSAFANAASFDFGTGAENTLLGLTASSGGVTASGWETLDSGSSWSAVNLWQRNKTADHGLGVCGTIDGGTTSACKAGGGDVNELDNDGSLELIQLTLGGQEAVWSSLWVSSLDAGGTSGSEEGIVWWGSNEVDGGAIYADDFFTFSFGACNVECDILKLAGAPSSITAKYLYFTPNFFQGDDNDYLVWKGEVSVPTPGTLGLLGLGLIGLGVVKRRQRAE